ncbi:AAA family ATPase [Vibrio sp. 10N.261.46.A3]|uniref:AAA family ATPase n=1 Tax=Vibrio sp. 10N.261.46.A3 TaxID=3229658 RepID=UPI00354D19A9
MSRKSNSMKLAYIFIAEHKILSNIDIPINGDHFGKYSNGTLTLNEKSDRVDYYNGLSCSAIIGKNGVGKSTILNFIESSYETTDSSGLIVFFDSIGGKYHICPINFALNEDCINSSTEYAIDPDYRLFINRNKIRLVKSNNLTGVEKSTFESRKNSGRFINDLSLSQYTSGSKTTLIKRTNRLMRFFSESRWFDGFERTKIKFNFKFKSSSNAYVNSLLSNKKLVSEYSEELDSIKKFINPSEPEQFLEIGYPDFTFYTLFKNNILSILRNISQSTCIEKNNRDSFFLAILILFIKSDFNVDSLSDLIKRKGSDFYRRNDSVFSSVDSFILANRYNKIVEVYTHISNLLTHDPSLYQIHKEDEVSSFNTDFIIDLTYLISCLPSNISSNFSYGWSGLSTGEFAKLNVFSELYNYINDEKIKGNENHLIVMDEADLYLHPDWQRTFFSELLNFLKSEFPQDRVQLILSSHSPIIIGDFLPEDIVSLDVNEQGQTKVVESFGFGTHITDLYLDGMHLNSTFGEHSKKVISSIIDNRNAGKLTENDRDLVRKIKSKNIQNMILGGL